MKSNCMDNSYKQKELHQNKLINPFAIAFCGYSNSGKTTLISKLIKELSKKYKIGYLKHDAHFFEIDKKGKDTYIAAENGANTIFINDPSHYAQIHQGPLDKLTKTSLLINTDIIFIEGYKNSDYPKIIFIDKEENIIKDIQKDIFTNVFAIIGQKQQYNGLPLNIPYFHRNNILKIKTCIINELTLIEKKIPLFGLVLTGGESTRMKKNKALLKFKNKPQYKQCYDLLSGFCKKVYISCKKEQQIDYSRSNLPLIYDMFLNIGPLGGILTAMKTYPKAAWFVLACDLPFVNKDDILNLIKKRNPYKYITAYKNSKYNFPEPLCAIYEPKSFFLFMQNLAIGCDCPKNILINSDINIVKLKNNNALNNINYPDEYQITLKKL